MLNLAGVMAYEKQLKKGSRGAEVEVVKKLDPTSTATRAQHLCLLRMNAETKKHQQKAVSRPTRYWYRIVGRHEFTPRFLATRTPNRTRSPYAPDRRDTS